MDALRRGSAILAAIGVHVLATWSIPAAPPRSREPVRFDELRFHVVSIDPLEVPVEPIEESAEDVPTSPDRAGALAASTDATRAPSRTHAPPSEIALEPVAPIRDEPVTRPTTETPPVLPSLDPRSVASSWLPLTETRPGPGATGSEAPSPLSESEAERGLSADLRRRAMAKAYLSPRREVALSARTDGSYVHQGNGFEATIRPDGTVEFRDRPGLTVDGPAALTMEDGRLRSPTQERVLPELLERPGGAIETVEPPTLIVGIGGSFDLQGELMRAGGQDPWLAERLHFLEETEELRDRLTDAHVAAERARALRRLPARLLRIWRDRARPAPARRAAIFALWDECSEDEADGRAARARIERFVREHLPSGSEDAYSEDELRALNASRVSHAEWSPY